VNNALTVNSIQTESSHARRFSSHFTNESKNIQETQLSFTNRATRLEVSQGHQTWYHRNGHVSIRHPWLSINVP